jgi:hypothetical protein
VRKNLKDVRVEYMSTSGPKIRWVIRTDNGPKVRMWPSSYRLLKDFACFLDVYSTCRSCSHAVVELEAAEARGEMGCSVWYAAALNLIILGADQFGLTNRVRGLGSSD